MESQANGAAEARVPDDVNIGRKDRHTTVDGKEVKIRSLKTGGMLSVLGALDGVGLLAIPQVISPQEFLTPEQRIQLINIEDGDERRRVAVEMYQAMPGELKFMLNENGRQYRESLMRLVLESRAIVPVAVAAISDVEQGNVGDLDPMDTIAILDKGIALTNWDELFKAARRFIPRLGVLTGAANSKPTDDQAAARKEESSAK